MTRTILFALLLAGLLLSVPVAAQAPPFLLSWGSLANGDGGFSEPRGLAVDASGNVYVTDYFPHSRIQVFDANGIFLRKWGTDGTGPGQFTQPEDIAIDGNGDVYVTDSGRERVQKFTSGGTFITQWGSYGANDGQFEGPRGIAVDASNNVYVVDSFNCRVQKFTSDGTFLLKWGSCGSGAGQFPTRPVGIEVDAAGTVFVTNLGTPPAIQRFSSTGDFLGQVGSPGTGPGFVYSPAAIVVDAQGNVYEADGSANRVQAEPVNDFETLAS